MASCISNWSVDANVAWLRKSKLHNCWKDFEVRTTSCSSIKRQHSSWPTWWNSSFLSNPSSLNLIQSSFLPLVAVEITTPIYRFPFGGHDAFTASPMLNRRPKLNVYKQPSMIWFLLATTGIGRKDCLLSFAHPPYYKSSRADCGDLQTIHIHFGEKKVHSYIGDLIEWE